jgi:hypothetical protein
LHRAKQIAPAAQIVVTVREENREHWEPALWFIRPEHRFVGDSRMTAPLTTAAALLSIAADSLANVVTILPARCYVANETSVNVGCLMQEIRFRTSIHRNYSGYLVPTNADIPELDSQRPQFPWV